MDCMKLNIPISDYSCDVFETGDDQHFVQGRSHISHQSHQQEWHLEHRLGHELHATQEFVIPGCMIQVDDPREDVKSKLEGDYL